jgi:hypothetical protein
MNKGFLVMTLVMGLSALAPSAAAFHGAPYSGDGTATDGTRTYIASVVWHGWWRQTYSVTLTDPLTQQVVHHKEFRGTEANAGGWPLASVWEIFLYHGYSLDPAVSFDIRGFQQILINPQQGQVQTMVYVGHYQQYQLVVAVAPYAT